MNVGVTAAAGLALGVAAIGALCDLRNGQIPNWLTLPPIVSAPCAYGVVLGIEHAILSLVATCLSAVVPYLLFRRGGMGGGDVKLLAALGGIMGFDLLVGLEIQLAAFAIAMIFACGVLVWRGRLLRVLASSAANVLRPFRLAARDGEPPETLTDPVKLGAPILLATGFFAAPHLALAWSAL